MSIARRLRWLLHAAFVVPMSQVKVLDLAYQVYVFELFHKVRINRVSHFVGIPVSLAATYVLVSPIAWAPPAVLAVVVGLQVAACARTRLFGVIPLILVVHALTWLVATGSLVDVLRFDGPIWLHPAFHVIAWPVLQYVTHGFEPDLPPPVSGKEGWVPMREFLRNAPRIQVFTLVMLAPLHAFVELVSSHRNFLVMLVLLAERLGYRPRHQVALRAWVDEECTKERPVLDYRAFRHALGDASPQSA